MDAPKPITFIVEGMPVPKQSTRFDGNGHAHTDPKVKAWQQAVAIKAREAMRGRPPLTGPVSMRVVFVLKDHRKRDLDNLNKGVSDALNGIVFEDDTQVVSLHLVKHIKKNPGICVQVFQGDLLPPFVPYPI